MIALKHFNQFGNTLLMSSGYVKAISQEEGPMYQFTRWLRLDQMVVKYSTKALLDFENLNQDLPNIDLPMDDIVDELKAARRDRQSPVSRHF